MINFRRSALLCTALVLVAFMFMPSVSSAHEIKFWTTPGYWGPLISCSGDGSGGLPACTSACDLIHTFQHLIYFGMTLAIFVFAPIFFAYGGIMMLIAGANPSLYSQGKDAITKTVIGVIITLSAFLIVNTFLTVFGQNSGAGTIQFGTIECKPGVNVPSEIKVNFSQPTAPQAPEFPPVVPGCRRCTWTDPNKKDCGFWPGDTIEKCATPPKEGGCIYTKRFGCEGDENR